MNMVIYGILGRFFRCLEQGTYVHVPGPCRQRRMPVPSGLCHDQSDPIFTKIRDGGLRVYRILQSVSSPCQTGRYPGIRLNYRRIRYGWWRCSGRIPFPRRRKFHPKSSDHGLPVRQRPEVAIVPAFSTLGNVFRSARTFSGSRMGRFFKAFNLRIPYGLRMESAFNGSSLTILVQAYNGFSAGINVSLAAGSAFLDTHLQEACGNDASPCLPRDSTSWIWAQDRLIISLIR